MTYTQIHFFFSLFFYTRQKRNYHYEYKRTAIETDAISLSSGLNVRDSTRKWSLCLSETMKTRSIRAGYILSRLQHGKIELAGIAPIPIADNKEEKSGNVSRRNGSSEDIVRSTSTTSRNKENGRIPLSCDSLCLKRVPQPRLVFIIFPVSTPLTAQDAPRSG